MLASWIWNSASAGSEANKGSPALAMTEIATMDVMYCGFCRSLASCFKVLPQVLFGPTLVHVSGHHANFLAVTLPDRFSPNWKPLSSDWATAYFIFSITLPNAGRE